MRAYFYRYPSIDDVFKRFAKVYHDAELAVEIIAGARGEPCNLGDLARDGILLEVINALHRECRLDCPDGWWVAGDFKPCDCGKQFVCFTLTNGEIELRCESECVILLKLVEPIGYVRPQQAEPGDDVSAVACGDAGHTSSNASPDANDDSRHDPAPHLTPAAKRMLDIVDSGVGLDDLQHKEWADRIGNSTSTVTTSKREVRAVLEWRKRTSVSGRLS